MSMKFLIIFLAISSLQIDAKAQNSEFAVEFDPITTAVGAKNLLLYYEPKESHWTFSAIGFSADFPEWVTDFMSHKNKGKGFDYEIKPSLGLGTDYFVNKNKTGAHYGLILFLWNYEVSRNNQTAEFSNLEILPRAGYRYFPFSSMVST